MQTRVCCPLHNQAIEMLPISVRLHCKIRTPSINSSLRHSHDNQTRPSIQNMLIQRAQPLENLLRAFKAPLELVGKVIGPAKYYGQVLWPSRTCHALLIRSR